MNFLRKIFTKPAKAEAVAASVKRCADPAELEWTAEDEKWGRRARTFDYGHDWPYQDPALVAWLGAGLLSDLTKPQIRTLMAIIEHGWEEGSTARELGDHLGMSATTVRFCISALNQQGYIQRSAVQRRDARGQEIVAWVRNLKCGHVDPDFLYGCFASI